MEPTVCDGDFYQIPSNEILENRKEFHRLKRGISESIEVWLNEVQNHANCCDFSKFVDFLLTDKFFCELNNDERDLIRSRNLRSPQQLHDYVGKRNVDHGRIDINGSINLNEYMAILDDIKLEPVCFWFPDKFSIDWNSLATITAKFRSNFLGWRLSMLRKWTGWWVWIWGAIYSWRADPTAVKRTDTNWSHFEWTNIDSNWKWRALRSCKFRIWIFATQHLTHMCWILSWI